MVPMLFAREDLFPMFNFRPGLDRLFEDFLEEKAPALPAMDIKETNDAIIVEAEFPGFTKDEIQVQVEKGMLHFWAERGQKKDERTNVHRLERYSGKMERLLALPDTVEGEKVEAAYKEGVLTLTLPKKPATAPKAIAVKVT